MVFSFKILPRNKLGYTVSVCRLTMRSHGNQGIKQSEERKRLAESFHHGDDMEGLIKILKIMKFTI